MKEVYIVDAVRTPVGKYGGTLSSQRPDDLLAHVIKAIMERNPSLAPEAIEEVISGAANQAGEDNRNVARMASLLAGLPDSVAGVTVNRLCASGLQAVIDASRAIRSGDGQVYLSGGVESMSRAPYVMAKIDQAFGRKPEMYDTTIGWRFVNPALAAMHYPYGMGETAENVQERYGISREAQDEFSYQTQLKYQAAHEAGKFQDEIVPVSIPQRKKDPIVFAKDEHPRLSEPQILAKLRPAFREGGTVTAGNASGINDGAAMLMLCDEETLNTYGLKPIAKVVSHAVAGVAPEVMGIGPVPATRKALKRAGLTVQDLDLIELNEAFAVQALACMQDLELDPSIVNVNGGSIAIGHPLGCSGARILTTLVHELKRRPDAKYGLATMCVGVGQGSALIVERM
ncbi:acetyl-CoA C-acyltransferase [Pontibacter sp. G13]|uniref:thiolase family protein n=1 Tax=Pontibacter sp. G13 TaxID=3074898 RepID=UPI00288B0F60|nr:acetyl-CoA C-acyltransferase [Pontibacter sp. G13]WNJ16855.1 acetyl-CoA C-acyltransferase [Pontibacter sp. G13]